MTAHIIRGRLPMLIAAITVLALAMALLFSPVQAQQGSAPAKPTGLTATATHDQVVLTWDGPGDDSITGYMILRRVRENDVGGEFSELVPDTGSTATGYTDDTVVADTTYTYRIKAINEHGVSERSHWFHIDIPEAPEPEEEEQDAERPGKPTSLTATATHDQVVLTWDGPGDDSITGYVILRRIPGVDPEGQFSELVADTGTAATTYIDDTVVAETRYTYRIKAINEHGVSERSRWSHINTPAAPVAAVSQPRSDYVDAHNAGVHELDEFRPRSDSEDADSRSDEEADDETNKVRQAGNQGKSVGARQAKNIGPRATVNICGRTPEVRDALLESIAGDVTCSTVTDAQLAGLEELIVDGYSSASIVPSDFAGLSSLSKLQISNSRQLTTLPENAFRELTDLAGFEELHLRSNRIKTIDPDAFDGLTFTGVGYLILSDNRISFLPPGSFSNVSGVKRLNLTDNHITGHYVSGLADGLTELEELYLIRNHIKVLPAGSFEGLTTLTILRLQRNGLTILETNTFSGLTALRSLNVSDNALQELPAGIFGGLGNLRNLYLDGNRLTALRDDVFDGLTGLVRLELKDNLLTELDEDIFDGLSELEILYLQDNELTQLDEDIFDGLSSLGDLYMGDNSFSELDEDIFDGLSSLFLLDMNGNNLTELPEDIFEDLEDLGTLNLYDNSLTSLPSDIFEPPDCLYELALSDNNFGTLPADVFDGLDCLDYLSLHRAGLTELDSDLFEPLTYLRSLYLFGNDLTTLPEDIFDDLGNLQRLYLFGNGLTELDEDVFDGLPFLQRLYLDANELTTLPADIFDGLSSLTHLYLDENELTALPANLFEDLDESLDHLYLRDNSLTALPSGVFDGLTGLRRLDLSCNALTALNLDLFDPFAGRLRYLDLDANPFGTPPAEAAVNAKLTELDALYLTGSAPCRPAYDTGLSELSLSTGTLSPAFVSPGISEYSTVVDPDISKLTITATPRSPNAFIEARSTIIPGRYVYDSDPDFPGIQVVPEDLGTLVNDIRASVAWRVIAENRAHFRNYSVAVFREQLPGSVARLRSLELSGLPLTPEFSSTTDDYEAEGPATATETIVTAIPLDPDASVEIMVNSASAEAGVTVDILPDPSTVTVKVTAEDGMTTQTYRVTVTRRAPDAPGEEGEFRLNSDMQEDYQDPDNSRYAGKQSRLEVFHAGRWGTVCDDRFKGSDNDSHPSYGNLAPKLSCKAMGYDDGEYASGYGTSEPHQPEADQDNYLRPGGAYPASGPLPIWLDDVMCWTRADWPYGDDPTPDYGRLMYLENPEDPEDQTSTPYLCAYAGWGLHNGTHREDAGVRCWYTSEESAQSEKALKGHFLLSPEQHDGSKRVTVKVTFSEPIDETPEGLRNHGVRVEGGEVTAVHREVGQPGTGTRSAGGTASGQVVWVIEIQPTSAEDLTLSLDGGRPCHEAGAICTADGRTLSEGISTTVKGPSSLTASFQDVPETHDGETPFTFRVAFSEDIEIGLSALREDAFTVTGGTVTDGQRVDDRHDLFEVTVEPNSAGDVTITLPAGRDCSVSGAICTTGKNQRLLSNSPRAKVAGPTNNPATGAPSISGTAQVGETLRTDTSNIEDADGLSGETFTYQWVSGDGTTDTDIEKATDSTYKLVDADKGNSIKVRVTFTDDAGNAETLTSAATGPVLGDGLPGAPRNLTATPGNREVTLSWDPPADNGNAPATRYRIEWRIDGKDYKKGHWGPSGETTYTKTDLANGVKYIFRVKAENGNGNSYGPYGPASEEVSATPTSGSAVDLGTPVLSNTKTLHHGMVKLDWEDVEDAGWYVVQYYHVKGGEWLDLPAAGVDIAFHGSSAVVSNLHGLSWLRVGAASCDGSSEWSQIEELYGTNASDWEGVPVPEVEEGDEIEPCPVVLGTPVLSNTETLHHGMVRLDWEDIEDAGWYVVQYYHVKGGEWLDLPAAGVEIAFHGSSAVVSNLHGLSWLRVGAASCDGASEWSQIEELYGTNASDWEGVPVPEVAEGDEIEPCSEDADTSDNSPATGVPTISGTAQVGETLTADKSGIADADGLTNATHRYQWLADDAAIAGATGSTYTLADSDEGKAITVQVSFTDDAGNNEALTSAATDAVAAAPTPNNPATGAPTISGTAQVGETLTADRSGIADADGLSNVQYEYQWLADDTAIQGATDATHTLANTEEGKAIKVQVSFTDDAGNNEALTSAATGAVSAAEPTEPPARPTGLSATASHDSVTLTWDDPGDDSITGYVILRRVRENDVGGDFSELVADTGTAATTYTDDTVAAGTTYTYRIKAINGAGTSERSRWFHIDIPAALVPDKPTGLSATASHDVITLTWEDPGDDSITGYVILRRLRYDDPSGHFDELVADTGTAAITYTDDTVKANTHYTYRIKAINEHGGVSERSRWFHIQTQEAP